MNMGRLRQLGLLLWKNYKLQIRKKLVTVLEIALPTLFAVILVLIRRRVIASDIKQPTTWDSFSIDKLPPELVPVPILPFLPWKLAYTPNSIIAGDVMKHFPSINHISKDFKAFDTEEEMVDYLTATDQPSNIYFLGGIVFKGLFQNATKGPTDMVYKIRLPSSPRNPGHGKKFSNPFLSDTRWYTGYQFPLFQKVGPREVKDKWGGTPGYMREGFLTVQHGMNQAIRSYLANTTGVNNKVILELQRFPYPPYNDDNFVLVIQNQFPLLLMLSFVFSALHIVKDIVHEKERKLKESMKMMGLAGWLHWLAWFIKYFLFLLIAVAIMTTLFCIRIPHAVITYTHWSVILVFLILYSIATISFCFAVSVFFKKANSAAAAGGVLFFVTFIPYSFLQQRYNTLTWGTKIGCCLISNVAMALGGQVIGMYEGTAAGVTWENINRGVSVDDTFTMLHVMIMLIVDSVLYILLAWYVEAVAPGDYGIPQPWYFPFTRSYWCGNRSSLEVDLNSETTPLLQQPTMATDEYFEADPVNLLAGIKIKNLKKKFGKGQNKKVAVAGMTLNMYEGQITALLGHNGAGKTTTMSMLTGFIPPTRGTAVVNGYDILEDLSGVRSSLGLCPQHDVLFDTLTVEEHLVFFAKLKDYPTELVLSEVTTILKSIGLHDKRHAQAKTLSGGMKRKLSVGIALIGGSKVVILDEPTSGMDPDARRHTWDILQRHRPGRTMLLTTHFMDEADLLGDRIAIMANGVVKCCGSSLFLKNKYGAGYYMVIVKDANCNVDRITRVVLSHVPTARLESNVSAELSYILPHESSQHFEDLFIELEDSRSALGIGSFGASVTTMEEVFLRVGEESNLTVTPEEINGPTSPVVFPGATEPEVTVEIQPKHNHGLKLGVQQFWAMFVKHMLHTARNVLVTTSQLMVPLFFTIMGLIVVKTLPEPRDSPPLLLNLDKFAKHSYVPFAHDLNASSATVELAGYFDQVVKTDQVTMQYLNNMSKYAADPNVDNFIVDLGVKSLPEYNSRYPIAAKFQNQDVSSLSQVAMGSPQLTMATSQVNMTSSQVAMTTSQETTTTSQVIKVTGLFNDQAYHTPAMILGALDNVLLRYVLRDNYTISTMNHPLPRSVQDKVNDDLTIDFIGFTVSFNVMFGMSFLVSSFVLFLVKERSIKAKHSQFVSGVHPFTFWSSTFCWNFINYIVPCLLLILTFVCFNIEAYINDGRWGYVLLLFALYGWAMLPMMYLMSFMFKVPSSGLVWLTMFNILAGVATVLAVNILAIPQLETADIGRALEWAFLAVLPNFCLGQGLQDFYLNSEFLKYCDNPLVEMICNSTQVNISCCAGHCGDTCADYQRNYLAWESRGIGRMLVFLAAQGLMYFSFVFLVESNLPRRVLYALRRQSVKSNRYETLEQAASISSSSLVQEDSDVMAERERVKGSLLPQLLSNNALVINGLTKYYDSLLAVDHITVAIPRGECFGLLGVNGAGKTTTFKMLTGDETMSRGAAYLVGLDVSRNLRRVQQRIGYCPQFDALISQMTGRETLRMYARLRGMQEADIPAHIDMLIRALLLQEHADRMVGAYSGGNKRKLSTAIALVGNPPIVFLDEPSTGMDPVARRHLWNFLSHVRSSGRTLVLTSHSMEECEALCTKIAIMVNGQFKCLGSQQHLKAKFGEGYTLLAKVKSSADGSEGNTYRLREFIESTFPSSTLKDLHEGMVHYHILKNDCTWAEVFGTMERAKEEYHIEDYSVSQTTLEQVFLNFARAQTPPAEESKGCTAKCCSLCQLLCCCTCCRPSYQHTVLVNEN